jgi:hypothetical protein
VVKCVTAVLGGVAGAVKVIELVAERGEAIKEEDLCHGGFDDRGGTAWSDAQ